MKNANLQMLQLDILYEEQPQRDLTVIDVILLTDWSGSVPIPHSGKQDPFPTTSNPNFWSQRTAYSSAQLKKKKKKSGLLQIQIQRSHFSESVLQKNIIWLSVNVSEMQKRCYRNV